MDLANKSKMKPLSNAHSGPSANKRTPMGRRMREEHFMFEEGFVNLNHGIFDLAFVAL
jgi:hypothetical protein